MAANKWREEFIARMSREGMQLDLIRKVMRHAATLNRLAVAQCNGDWPADNGERTTVVCAGCESAWHPSVMKGRPTRCPDCRTADRVRELLHGSGWFPVFGGDPRGCVLKLARECHVMEYPAGTWRATVKRDHGHSTESNTFDTEAQARAWWPGQIDNGRAESNGDVIGVPS